MLAAAPDGYALCAITTPSALSITSEPSASLHVYGDGVLADPYDGPLIGVAAFEAGPLADLPLGVTTDVTVGGAPGRLGRTDGLLVADLPAETGRVLTYQEGARTLQLVVRGDDDVDLLALAAGVRRGDGPFETTIDAGALPAGFVALGDLYQLEGRARFRFAVDYQRRDEAGAITDQVTLLGAEGDAASMEAFRFRAASSEVVDVNGSPGISADIGPEGTGPRVVSWLVGDDLILRIFSFRLSRTELLDLATQVRLVDGDEWQDLRAEFDPALCDF